MEKCKKKIDYETLLMKAIEDIPHNCTYCGLRGSDHNFCEYHDRPICAFEVATGCHSWEWRGFDNNKKLFFHDNAVKVSFKEDDGYLDFAELGDLGKKDLEKLCFEIDVIVGRIKSDFNPVEDSKIRILTNEREKIYLTEFNKRDLQEFRKEVLKYLKK